MSISVARYGSWPAGIDAGCERLVSSRIRDGEERGRLRRLVGILLAAPFVIAPALLPALASLVSGPVLMAATCAVFALCWIGAAAVAATGKRQAAEFVFLIAATTAIAAAIAGGGGIASPAVLLTAALAFEPWWVTRSKGRAVIGAVAAVAALALSGIALPLFPPSWLAMSAWVWLAPGFYIALTLPRIAAAEHRGQAAGGPASGLDDEFDAAVISVSRNGEIVDATLAAGKMFGRPSELLAGRSLFEHVHVGDRVALVNALAGFEASSGTTSVELRVRVRDGELSADVERFVHVAFEPLKHEQSDGVITLLVREMTDVVRLKDELFAAQEVADSIEIAKSRFLAAVSHELRTPLNAIIGFSDMMLNDLAGELADKQREYVGMISQSGNHLLSVVNAILDVSRIESGSYGIRPEPFVVADAVELCGSMMAQQAAARGLELNVTVRPGVRELVGDRRAVQQIIINLLTNAIKFTPEGGAVSLDVYRLGNAITFVVTDNGIGIASDDLCKLGRPFTQLSNDVSRQFEGAGLGLSLVKGLVTLHEGKLEISSTLGEGTEVKVALPIEGPKQDRQEPDAAVSAGTATALPTMRIEDEKIRKTA